MNVQTEILTPPEQGLMSLSDLLKKKRAEKGMTQKELADEAGLSLSALKQYETGRSQPTIEKLKAMSAVLEIAPNDIWSELDVGVARDPELRMNVLTKITEMNSFAIEKASREQLENIRDFVDNLLGNPTDPAPSATAIQRLAEVVNIKGLEGRSITQALTAAKLELDGLDWVELVDLGAEYNIDFDGGGTEKDAEDVATARILVAVLYETDLMQRPLAKLENIREWINSDTSNSLFEDEIVKGSPFFESEEEYVKRLQNELPVPILAKAEKRLFLPEAV